MLRRLIFLAAFVVPAAGHAYPVPLGLEAELHTVARDFAKQNPSQLSEATLTRILIGHELPTSQTAASWRKSLNEALKKDALFEIETAQSLRNEVQKSYETSATLNFEQIQLRAQMGHDSVASLLAEGQKLRAMEVARETIRRFQDIDLDRKRHPPSLIAFFQKQKELLKNKELGEILVRGNMTGLLYADGTRLGPINDQTRYSLPQGNYRLWVRNDTGRTLSRPLTVGGESQVVSFDQALDQALQVTPHHHLSCKSNCVNILGKFAQRLGTTSITGLRRAPEGNGLYEVIAVNQKGNIQRKTLVNRHGLRVELAAPISTQHVQALPSSPNNSQTFSALWLLPAGGGQFSQGRWGWGIAWASLEAGLLAWNIQAATSYYSAEQGSSARNSAENQAKISGGILYTTIALGIAEAILVGLLSEPEPE